MEAVSSSKFLFIKVKFRGSLWVLLKFKTLREWSQNWRDSQFVMKVVTNQLIIWFFKYQPWRFFFIQFSESCIVIIVPGGGGGMTFLKKLYLWKMRTQDFQNLKKTSWLVLKMSNCHSKSVFSTMTFYFLKCHGYVTTMTFNHPTMTL